MRVMRVLVSIVMLCCTIGVADSMDAQGTASGTVVLYFSGTSASGSFDSDFVLTGNLTLDDVPVGFSASGWARGSGAGDTVTLDLDAQATFAATGSTDTGERISVQGGLTLAGLSAGESGSAGSGTGDFFASVFIGDRVYRVQGYAEGSASGGFVVPEDPYSMELAGEGTFDLSGDMTLVSPAAPSTPSESASTDAGTPADDRTDEDQVQADTSIIDVLPWDTSTWPEPLLAELLDILTNVVEISLPDDSPPAGS